MSKPSQKTVSVRSNIPIVIDVKLGLAGVSESVSVVDEPLVQPASSSSETRVDESFIRRLPGANGGRQLQNAIATTPGWRTENDGLLHIRGVDDGILYVVDGVPVSDRQDVISGNSYDTETIRSFDVMTGNIPAESGGRSGAVVSVQSKSMSGAPFTGSVGVAGESQVIWMRCSTAAGESPSDLLSARREIAQTVFSIQFDPANLNNRGGALRLNVRSDWRPTSHDLLMFAISTNGTDFHITNDLEQELAGNDSGRN